jgi:hypothetical protein
MNQLRPKDQNKNKKVKSSRSHDNVKAAQHTRRNKAFSLHANKNKLFLKETRRKGVAHAAGASERTEPIV